MKYGRQPYFLSLLCKTELLHQQGKLTRGSRDLRYQVTGDSAKQELQVVASVFRPKYSSHLIIHTQATLKEVFTSITTYNKGLETLKKFEPLNGVIFSSATHVLLNFGQTAILYMGKMFCTMWGYYHQRGETRISEDCSKIIVLEVGGLIVFQLRNIYTIEPDLPFSQTY